MVLAPIIFSPVATKSAKTDDGTSAAIISSYTAKDLSVLEGLDAVRKRPGMYTDTTRPNHLAQEVIDNSVDEALAGHASRVEVTLHKDGSLSVFDDGRGMPIDMHPEEKISGVELIFCKLHAGVLKDKGPTQFDCKPPQSDRT